LKNYKVVKQKTHACLKEKREDDTYNILKICFLNRHKPTGISSLWSGEFSWFHPHFQKGEGLEHSDVPLSPKLLLFPKPPRNPQDWFLGA